MGRGGVGGSRRGVKGATAKERGAGVEGRGAGARGGNAQVRRSAWGYQNVVGGGEGGAEVANHRIDSDPTPKVGGESWAPCCGVPLLRLLNL